MIDRRFFVGGVFATLLGVAFFANAGLAFRFPVTQALVTIAGLASALLAVVGVSTRMRVRRHRTTPPDPGPSPAAPGEELEDALRRVRREQHIDTAAEREAVFDRLTAVAIQLLQRREGIDVGEVRRRLATGEWTADPEAAAFFEQGPEDEASFVDRLSESFSDDSRFARRARRAAEALDDLEVER